MELVSVGYFSKAHGIKGQLVLKAESEFYFEEVKAVFIEKAGSKAPFFVKELKESNGGLIVSLEEVNDLNTAKSLLGKQVFIDQELVEASRAEEDWTGFELIDKHYGSLGAINSVDDTGYQVLVTVTFKNKEVILPLVDEFIEAIDEEGKKIKYEAPEGLIDVYLGEEE